MADRSRLEVTAAVAAPDKPASAKRAEGHSALLQGLGRLGDVAPSHMPWLLRLAHIRHAQPEAACHPDMHRSKFADRAIAGQR